MIKSFFKWIGTSIEEDKVGSLGRMVSHRKLSVMYMHLLLTFMVISTGWGGDWNYPTEVWWIVSGGSIGYSAIRAWQKTQEIKSDNKVEISKHEEHDKKD